jgi:hypothetical protein
MERKNLREGKLPFSMQAQHEESASSMGKAVESDDEFFDCDDDRLGEELGNKG